MKRTSRSRRMSGLLLPAVLLFGAVCLLLLHGTGSPPDYANDGLLRVCIDAGHGGHDPGAVDLTEQRYEKDDCLSMALAIQAVLTEKYPEIEVLLTRSEDFYLELQERCDLANDFRADLFVSLHRNSAQNDAQGVEIWIPSRKPSEDKQLAQAILEQLDAVGLSENRGVRSGTASNSSGNYYVLSHTDMPGCLIELGFMTSPEDNHLLDAHHSEYAAAIAGAIADRLLEQ